MSRRDRVTHTLGAPPVDDLGVKGTTIGLFENTFVTLQIPRTLPPQSCPVPIPSSARASTHLYTALHNAYHCDHHSSSKEMALPRASRLCPPVTSKEHI